MRKTALRHRLDWMSVLALLLLPTLAFGQAAPTVKSSKAWIVPRTPDGVPDLQGIWNNATLTPLERAKEYEGKPFLTAAEAAEFEKKELYSVDGDRRDGGGGADVNRAYNEFWRERGRVTPDRRTALIVDPHDGLVPPLTAEARKRAAERAAKNRGHEFDGPENRSLAERCIAVSNAGPPMIPANYNANYQIVQAPGVVVILSEQIHDARIIRTGGQPHLAQNVRQLLGDSPRGMGRRNPGGRNYEFHGSHRVPRLKRKPPSHRALHAHRSGRHGLRIHGRRPRNLRPPLDGPHSHEQGRAAAAGVRLP